MCFCSHEYASSDGCARDAKTTLGPRELLTRHVQGSGHRRRHVLEPALPCDSQETHNWTICKTDRSHTSSGHQINDTLPTEKMQCLLNHENKCLYIDNIWPSLLYFDIVTSTLLLSDNQEKIPVGEMGKKRGSGVVWGGTLTLVCTRGLLAAAETSGN